MSLRYWKRDGTWTEDTIEWAKLYEDPAYRVVAFDGDEGGLSVSTIWMGISSGSLGSEEFPVHVYETARLNKNGNVVNFTRTSSEAEAMEMHREYCLKTLKREPRPEDGHVQVIVDRMKKARE